MGMSLNSMILVTASYDETLRFWNYETGICCREIIFGEPGSEESYNHSHINRLEITPDKRYLAASGNPFIRLYGLNTLSNKPLMSYKGHTNNVTALGFQRDGNWMYSGSEDGTIKFWDMRAKQSVREYISDAPINSVVLHPNERELISADQNGSIRVWDLTADSCSCELIPEVGTAMRSVAVSLDGELVVGASDTGACYIWSLSSTPNAASIYEPLHKLQAHDRYILKCLFSPASAENQRYLVTASSDCTVKIWNLDGFKLEQTLKGHNRWVQDCLFTNDGTHLMTASSDATVRCWAKSTWKSTRVYQGHKGPVNCCALYES